MKEERIPIIEGINTQAHPLKFSKDERLRHRSLVESLFAGGRSLYEFPLRMVYRIIDEDELQSSFRNGVPPGIAPIQMMVTVPKKKRRHAVDRVLMRRRIRAAYRLNRIPLAETLTSFPEKRYLEIAFIYLHNDNSEYARVESSVIKLLDKLVIKEFSYCESKQ